jgi:hypothetical protein
MVNRLIVSLLLAFVLVAPSLAYDVVTPVSLSLSDWSVSSGSFSDSSGLHPVSFSDRVANAYYYNVSFDLSQDFEIAFDLDYDPSGYNLMGGFDVILYSSSGSVLFDYGVEDYASGSDARTRLWLTVPGSSTYKSGLASSNPYSGRVVFSRSGGVFTVSCDGVVLKTFDASSCSSSAGYIRYSIHSYYTAMQPHLCSFTYSGFDSTSGLNPVTFSFYDVDSREPVFLTGSLYVVDGSTGSSVVERSFSSVSSCLVYLPTCSVFVPDVVHVDALGYDQIPAQTMVVVTDGGGSVPIYLRPLTGEADPGNAWVQFNVSGSSSSPISDVLVSMNGESYYTGSTGIARFQVPCNATYSWSMSSDNYDSKRGSVTVGTSDVYVPVSLVHSAPDDPRPSDPDNPLFPVLSPALDPSSYRLVIEGVPYLGTMASPLLDTMDELVYGLDDVVRPVLDLLTMPADAITRSVSTVSDQLVSASSGFVSTSSYVLNSVSMFVAVIPTKVINLVTFAMTLDIVLLLLRGGGI